VELLINDPVLKSSGLSIVRGRWNAMYAPPVLLTKKMVLFWKGVQSSESLAEEFKKKHQVFVFTGI
jgi:hypothetical protein